VLQQRINATRLIHGMQVLDVGFGIAHGQGNMAQLLAALLERHIPGMTRQLILDCL